MLIPFLSSVVTKKDTDAFEKFLGQYFDEVYICCLLYTSTSARLFVRKALEDNWDYWFNKMEDEKVQCAIEYKFKAELYETALLSYNILVDLSWACLLYTSRCV